MSNKYRVLYHDGMMQFVLDDFWYRMRHYMITLVLDEEKYEQTKRYTTSTMRKNIFSSQWEANREEFKEIWDLRFEKFAKELYANSKQVLHSVEGLDGRKVELIASFISDLES